MTEETGDETQEAPERWPLRFPEIEVPTDNPWRPDRLDRKRYGDLLTKLVDRTRTPFVLALDSAWGTGKTSFVKMWRQDLENQGYKTLYFNAWETDYVAEPLIALVGELGILGGDEARGEVGKLKSIAGKVIRKAIPVLVRVGTQGLLTLDDGDVEGAIGEFVQGVAQERIDDYENRKKDLGAFREALGKLVEGISDGRPLVFFIDELDRCRPSFAVELLERVKHLFEVPGIFFVLSTDRSQLAHSVRAVYGEKFDGEEYLRRFVDLTYVLPEPSPEAFSSYLLERSGAPSSMRSGREILVFLMSHLSFNLRQQQRTVTLLSVAVRCVRRRSADDPMLAAFAVLRIWRPSLFRGFLMGTKSAAEVLESLEEVDPDRWRSPRNDDSVWLEANFLAADLSRFDESPRSRARLNLHRSSEPSNEGAAVRSWSGEVLDLYQGLSGSELRNRRAWQILLEAVDLGRSFVTEAP